MTRQTGPTTDEGKAIASRNAIRHGLYAPPDVAVNDEMPGDWHAFLEAVVADLQAAGLVEEALARGVAGALWRLRRLAVAETMAIERATRSARGHAEAPRQSDGPDDAATFSRDYLVLPEDGTIDKLMRLEAHLSRQLLSNLHQLEAIRARRRGKAAPLARLDVNVPQDQEK